MEESAEAPPAAEEARRFRGSVLTVGRGSGWESADTTRLELASRHPTNGCRHSQEPCLTS